MIDLHLHILPGVDDGPHTLRESIEMLDWFAGAGYTRLVATPHLMAPLDRDYETQVGMSYDQLAGHAAERGLTLELGYEHMVSDTIGSRLLAGESSTLAGSNSVLIEFPFLGWNYSADRTLYDLEQQGFRPVLAHPERYVEVHHRPELVEAIAEREVVLQITLAAIAGTYGPDVRAMARKLLTWCIESDLPVILATDAHSMGRRLTDSLAGRAWVERNVERGKDVMEWAGSVVPETLLANRTIPSLSEWLRDRPPEIQASGVGRRFFRAFNPLARS